MSDIGEASEDECVLCREWPPALRQVMRSAVYSIPDDPVCEECVMAFWTNITVKASAKRQRPS
jgi:hypothetical protein